LNVFYVKRFDYNSPERLYSITVSWLTSITHALKRWIMKPKHFIKLLTLLLAVFILAGCASSSQGGAGSAAQKYFQAIADGNEEKIAAISCPDWEASARADVAAFIGVTARLEDVTCQPVSEAAGEAVVECTGAIVATYNNEDASFELKDKQLKVVNQDGEWLVCGYAQ